MSEPNRLKVNLLGMVAHTFNRSIWKAKAGSLVYTASSSSGRAVTEKPYLKKEITIAYTNTFSQKWKNTSKMYLCISPLVSSFSNWRQAGARTHNYQNFKHSSIST